MNDTAVTGGVTEITVTAKPRAINADDVPGARAPRLRVVSNGAKIPGALEAEVTQRNHFHAGRFTARFAPAATGATGTLAWWAKQTTLPLDVQFGFSPGGQQASAWTSIMTGDTDDIRINPIENTVEVEGRDYTAKLIDYRTYAAYQNQTSSEVATTLAGQVGLSANVTKTTTLVSRYYAEDHTELSQGQFHRNVTAWDLITSLARFEGFDAYVTGSTLYFGPPPADNAKPYALNWSVGPDGVQTGNVLTLTMERKLTISKGTIVTVRSWNSRMRSGFNVSYPSAAGKMNTNAQLYYFERPNLTHDQALRLAQSIYKDITQHELRLTAHVPGDPRLNPRVPIRLTDTGTVFDTTYHTEEVTHALSNEGGYVTGINAKNIATDTEVAALGGSQGGNLP